MTSRERLLTILRGGIPDCVPVIHQMKIFLRWYRPLVPIGTTGSIIGTFMTRPTDRRVLDNFYRTTRPFGFWEPLMGVLDPEVRTVMLKEHRNDILALPFALAWQITLFLLPMQLIIKSYHAAALTSVVFIAGLTGMYFFWYRNLPKDEVLNRRRTLGERLYCSHLQGVSEMARYKQKDSIRVLPSQTKSQTKN